MNWIFVNLIPLEISSAKFFSVMLMNNLITN